jgi:D-galactarolactone cycloisomerase
MSLIRDIELIALEHALAPGKAYGSARGLVQKRTATLVRVHTEDGVLGVGEAWGPPALIAPYLDIVRGYYAGRSIFDQRVLFHHILAKHYHFGAQNALISLLGGIDIALYDAMGKRLGVPVYQLLGGKARDKVAVYASGGYITRDHENQLQYQLRRIADRGYNALKIKIGLNPASDAGRVELARSMFPHAHLMVDANGNYTLDAARESMKRIAPFDVSWYEEPLAPQDFDGYRALHRDTPIPLATGEALYTAYDFDRMLSPRALDVAQPDITLCGGLSQAKLIADLCLLRHARLSPHVWGGAVGLAAAVHLVAAHSPYPHSDNEAQPCYLEYDVGDNRLRDEILKEPLHPVNGFIAVPNKPGLGIELDERAVVRLRVK